MSRWMFCTVLLVTAFAGIGFGDEPNVPTHAVAGRVLDENGVGVSGVQVRGLLYQQTLEATTGEDGSFSLDVNPDRVSSLLLVADDVEGDRMGLHSFGSDRAAHSDAAAEIRLQPVRRIDVSVVDPEGAAASGVELGVIAVSSPVTGAVTNEEGKAVLRIPVSEGTKILYAWKPGVGFDYRHLADPAQDPSQLDEGQVQFELSGGPPLKIRLVDEAENPIVGLEVRPWYVKRPGAEEDFNFGFVPHLFSVKTDEQGVAEFRGLPNWNDAALTFWPYSKDFEHRRIMFGGSARTDVTVTTQLYRRVTAGGLVTFPDGRPAANVKVVAEGQAYGFNVDRASASADADGRFEMRLAPEMLYMLGIQDDRWAAPAIEGVVLRVGKPVDDLDFRLRSPTRVFGTVTFGQEKATIVGLSVSLRQRTRALTELEQGALARQRQVAEGEKISPSLDRRTKTDGTGTFEFFVGPGSYQLQANGIPSQTVEVKDELELRADVEVPR